MLMTGAPEKTSTEKSAAEGMSRPLQSEHQEKFYELHTLTSQVANTFNYMVSEGR